jgi:hypothetical protein
VKLSLGPSVRRRTHLSVANGFSFFLGRKLEFAL